MKAKVTWTGGRRSFGSIGFNFSVFTLDTIRGGDAYRLINHLPGVPDYERETFHGSEQDAQAYAERKAFEFLQKAADIATSHPVIQVLDKATQFEFPKQYCPGGCPFSGGTAKHEDVVVEKIGNLGWAAWRPDFMVFDRQQNWASPRRSLGKAGTEHFIWPEEKLGELILQVHFMHCG